ncbi:hypothetical protein CEUSTIGMA_g3617.t1 [Chlamydomonas eustigma]|uniref:ShKT domain-containing protein n=1 Tax=Chlamydomonas eustigma TaxID=1157962 RepID=A0A250WZA3_9CHLO|nr:hypothetical protein CEUSTIGMA_g3617.t1 [Chlamydomonas eustigma]|eukprot:GAX76173.1 hypothetical protein CEUSTIGMA_g3617.t1 [Chlamydomonas eustigma]
MAKRATVFGITKALQWTVTACIALVILSNVLYFTINLRAETKTLQKLHHVVVAKATTLRHLHMSNGSSLTGRGLQDPPSWDMILENLAHNNAGPKNIGENLFASAVCEDDIPSGCLQMVLQGECRYEDVPIQACRRSCGMCPHIIKALSTDLDFPVHLLESAEGMSCSDASSNSSFCTAAVKSGFCDSDAETMLKACAASCGFCAVNTLAAYKVNDTSGTDFAAPQCADYLNLCPYLAKKLLLCSSPASDIWMTSLCARSCGACIASSETNAHIMDLFKSHDVRPKGECENYDKRCDIWSHNGFCSSHSDWMTHHCLRSCGQCSVVRQGALESHLSASNTEIILGDYRLSARRSGDKNSIYGLDAQGRLSKQIYSVIMVSPIAVHLNSATCVDQQPSCRGWAEIGECTKNTAFMFTACALSCGRCTPLNEKKTMPAPKNDEYVPQPLASVVLNNGVLMPVIGFGTAGLGAQTVMAVQDALHAGYRHFDTAQAREWYLEEDVGAAIDEVLVSGSAEFSRSDLFLTTKIHPKHLGYNLTLEIFDSSLRNLRTNYVDLVLLHYPRCWNGLAGCPSDFGITQSDLWKESWKALEKLYTEKKTRAIGVSNFNVKEVLDLISDPSLRVMPQVLQVNVDPLSPNTGLVDLCRNKGIQLEAYSSLGTQHLGASGNPVLGNAVIKDIAHTLSRSPAQVVLRWALQKGLVVLPRSSNAQHMQENLDLFSFGLDIKQMTQINMISTMM